MGIVRPVHLYLGVVADHQKSDIASFRENQRSRRSQRVVVFLWIDPGDHPHQRYSSGHT